MSRFLLTGQLFLISVFVLPFAAGRSLVLAAPPAEIVRDDWYFRDSLAAIRDWESTLAGLEKQPTGRQVVPGLPRDGAPRDHWRDPNPRLGPLIVTLPARIDLADTISGGVDPVESGG